MTSVRELVERELKHLLHQYVSKVGEPPQGSSDEGEQYVDEFEKWVKETNAEVHKRAVAISDPEEGDPFMDVVQDRVNEMEEATDDEIDEQAKQ